MAVSKLVGGYECTFVENPPEAFQTECIICLLVLREPYQVICCGQSYCHSCIKNVKVLNNPCPHCNERNFNDFPNKGLQQSLHKLTVRCSCQNEGCEWTGELGELDNHLNLDPQPNNQLKGCAFVMVKCTHCSESHQRQHINHHQIEVCPKRPFACEHCKVYKSTFEDVKTNHWPMCECYPVECSNKCGAVLQQQNLESHVAEDCPLTVIECDFHYAGCEVNLPRKDMGEHLRVELVKHTSMMAAGYKQQQDQDRQRTDELVKENETLKQRVSELEKELKINHLAVISLHGKSPPINIVMLDLKRIKETKDIWYSPPFYTHYRGYRLCLMCKCYSNFNINTFLSVYIYMMRGEFDDELNWPLKGEATITLLSQSKLFKIHETGTIDLANSDNYSRVTEGERNLYGTGIPRFINIITLGKLYTDTDGNLHFRVSFKFKQGLLFTEHST